MNFKFLILATLFTCFCLIDAKSLIEASQRNRKLVGQKPGENECTLQTGLRDLSFDVPVSLTRIYSEIQVHGGKKRTLAFKNGDYGVSIVSIFTQDRQTLSYLYMNGKPIPELYVYFEVTYFDLQKQKKSQTWKVYHQDDCIVFLAAEIDPTKVDFNQISVTAWFESDDPMKPKN